MVYVKSSFHYWFTLFFCVGILQGQLFRGGRVENWMGAATEWIGRERQTVFNPITRCYTRKGIHRLFKNFVNVTARKEGFYFYAIPKIGRLYRRYQLRRYGVHPGGAIVYGEPWPYQGPLEKWLGKYIGFAWFCTGRKAVDRDGAGSK